MVAGVELDKDASGHDMSNQESKKRSLVFTYNYVASLLCTAQSLGRW